MALTAKKVYAILKRQISDMEAKLNSPVRYRGTVATADLLPLNPDIGDMYNIESKSVYGEAGMNVAWNGVVWDTMGAPIDMSLYIKSSELADWVKQQNKPAYTAEEVGALPADTKIPSKTSELKNDSGFLTKVPDSYLNGTDTTLKESGKAADAKATGDKFAEMSADISKKLDKNQGSENSGKIAGINESGDIVPMFPVGVEYNEETNCLEFGSDQGMKLNQGIGLDSTLTKTGFAADAGVTGKEIDSLKESISTKITKFYASSQGETHLADSDNGKIMDMMLYGKSEQKQYSGKNLFKATLGNVTANGITCTANSDGTYILKGTCTTSTALSIIGIFDHILNEPLYLTGVPSGCSSYLALGRRDGDNILVTDGKNVKIDAGIHTDHIEFWITEGTVLNNVIFKPMITTDPTATYDDFEPYTGGIPSPNPDYPQEIKSVVNPTVRVCGKNLFNYNAWKGIPVTKGTAVFENNGVTLTATRDDCYTNYEPDIFGVAKIPVSEGETVTLSWESNEKEGNVTIFPDGVTGNHVGVKNEAKKISYMVQRGTTFITFRFGVANAGDTISYKNIQLELGSTPTAYEPYHEQTAALPYDLYGIKVTSGGNVTIDGQQYVSDYFDVERGKLVRCVKEKSDTISITVTGSVGGLGSYDYDIPFIKNVICNITNIIYEDINQGWASKQACISGSNTGKLRVYLPIGNHDVKIIYELETPEEIDLTQEEIAALKAFATYYPATNISVNSDQLDGYTTFDYPISMRNGWNYVKQQIGDTREYIYDMDARTQDTDLQAAEAYVNSEYAVALTELEV